jgi:hypothetical protein
MIANELFRLATYKKGCIFTLIEHYSMKERIRSRVKTIQLKQNLNDIDEILKAPLDAMLNEIKMDMKPPFGLSTYLENILVVLNKFGFNTDKDFLMLYTIHFLQIDQEKQRIPHRIVFNGFTNS